MNQGDYACGLQEQQSILLTHSQSEETVLTDNLRGCTLAISNSPRSYGVHVYIEYVLSAVQ